MVEEQVVLVDENDQVVGTKEKMEAHRLGLLHRAFSVVVYRQREGVLEILLQQRHQDKYHCGGLWTNTCCSHPRVAETTLQAANRRLEEEMSLRVPLREVGQFQYRAEFSNGLIEHELDHVFVGEFCPSQEVRLHPEEAQAYAWHSLEQTKTLLRNAPEQYTPWFKPVLDIVEQALC